MSLYTRAFVVLVFFTSTGIGEETIIGVKRRSEPGGKAVVALLRRLLSKADAKRFQRTPEEPHADVSVRPDRTVVEL